jgi:hypothetical protein
MTKKKSSGKKKVTARRSPVQEAPRQPARRQETEAPRQPARRQETEGTRQSARRQETETTTQPTRRQEPFQLVLPTELADLASARNLAVVQVRPPTTQPPPRQTPTTQPPPRQPPTAQTLPGPRQPPTTQSGTRARELLSSQETIETIPSRVQSQQSAPREMLSSQESITSRVQNQLLLSQTSQAPLTLPELFDEPPHDIRGGDYDTSLNYRVEDEHLFGESSTAGMVRGAILEADARPTIPSASRRPERSTPRGERRQSPERASTERSITPYRRYVPYRNPLEFRGLADERSGETSPYQYRPIVRETPSLPVEASNNEGKYNLLRKFSRYFLINFLLTFLSLFAGKNRRVEPATQQRK